jgi:hypothetical protein
LTRSSAAPLTVVTPLAQAAAMKNAGKLVDRERHKPRRRVDAVQTCGPDLDIRNRFRTVIAMVDQAQVGAH